MHVHSTGAIFTLVPLSLMNPEAITPFDLHRIFMGDYPWWFGLEIAGRTAILFVYTLVLVRTLGARTLGQLTIIEYLLVVAIGSAVGDPMFYHDVPLIHGMIVVTVVVGINRFIVAAINRNERVEVFIEGEPAVLVKDGHMLPEVLKKAHLNREQLFEELRLGGVRNLGELEMVFLEQCGRLSIFRRPEREYGPGLLVAPPWDSLKPARFAAGERAEGSPLGCESCGAIIEEDRGNPLPECVRCGNNTWADAVAIKHVITPERA